MSRREALLSLLQGETVSPIPFSTYGVDRYSHPWMAEDPSFERVLKHTDEYEYILALHCSYYASFGYSDILELPDPEMVELESWETDDARYFRRTVHTPQGDLSCLSRLSHGLHTAWQLEYLIKDDGDIDKFLSIPFKPRMPDKALFLETRDLLGDKGLMEIEIPNPLCIVAENMIYEDFMVRSITMKDKMIQLLDRALELILEWLDLILPEGFGPVFRIFGPEYGAPPYMHPDFFEWAVLGYDKHMVDKMHQHGCYARMHMHGPVRNIIPHLVDLGVDMFDPCEPPPNGDITLDELISMVGTDIVLMGDIELDDIERNTPAEVDRLVAQAMDTARGRSRFICTPSAFPIGSPLPDLTAGNLIQFIDSCRKHGAL